MAATWGTPFNLKGRQGDAGLSVLPIQGVPKSTDGADGQIAITDTGDEYFKANGAWTKQRSLVGPAGMNGLNAQFLHGSGAPNTTTFTNDSDAIYIQDGGEVWYFDYEGTKVWTDANYSLRGLPGTPGADGARGSQRYFGNGPPSSDLTTFSPNGPARTGDEYLDTGTSGGPYLYILGS